MLKNECTRNCWLAAAVAGLLVWIFNATFVGGLVLGLITFFLMGNALVWLVCSGRGGVAESAEVLGPRATAHDIGDGGILDRAEDAVVHAGAAFAAGTVSAVGKGQKAIHDMREEHRRDREREARGDRDDDDDRDDDEDDGFLDRAEDRLEQAGDAVKDAMGALAARGKAALKGRDSDGDHDGDHDAPLSLRDGSIIEASSTPEVTPLPAKAPKPAKPKAKVAKAAVAPDNLKEIKGVGPQLEKLLHDNGVTSFAQIAAWGDAEIDHFAEVIGRMGGRIRSDDWVEQAKILAAGQDTVFSRRVDKGEVY